VLEDQTVVLRLLAERRDDLGHERARVLNRLHQLFRELGSRAPASIATATALGDGRAFPLPNPPGEQCPGRGRATKIS
jgi:hypothetical protein